MDRKEISKFLMFIMIMMVLLVLPTTKCSGLYLNSADNTELIQQHVGSDIRLQCDWKGLINNEILTNVKIHWFFMQCSDNPKHLGRSCKDFQQEEWIQLPCVDQSLCNSDLLLRNVTEQYSGLYRCTIYPYHLNDSTTLGIQLVRTYQLDVKLAAVGVPEFLDSLPDNKTTTVGLLVVLQCRVRSMVHPMIKWFRRLPEPSTTVGTNSLRIFQYNGRSYELLDTAREKFISDDTYLSKLILNGVRLQDEGFYVCVPITYQGHGVSREAYLKVYANEAEYWADYGDSDDLTRTDPKEFWLLFLMPLGLAMLPLSVWMCFVISKKFKINNDVECDENGEQQHYYVEATEVRGDQWMLKN